MSLSVCLITRNEETSLARALGSVQAVADQTVVTDTGSTDQTVAVAQEHGARVSHFVWDDDFAAARNFALDQATGDWVLWLNPDEELLPAGQSLLRQCLTRADAFAYGVVVQELPRADRTDLVTEAAQLRLFRRRHEVRYRGRLHPDFHPPLEDLARRENKQLLLAAITIRRHTYLSQLNEGKLRWAVRLLELELRDRPGQLAFLIEYGHNLLLLKDPRGHAVMAEAVEQVCAQRTAPAAPSPAVQRLLEYLLTVSPQESQSRLRREEATELARRWFPHSPPLLWRLAENAFQAENFQQAAEVLERLLECGRSGSYDRSEAFDPSILGEPAVMNLGVCYVRLKDFDRAEHCFRQLLQSPAYQTQAVQNLALVHDLRLQGVRRSDAFWATGGQ